jgi:1-acyl-sn-glycerol-3-phosphate acyltransferase
MLRALAGVLTAAYGVCALAVFSLLFMLAAVLALVVPRLQWRRAIIHRVARLALPLLGVRLEVNGLDRLPAGSCVVVANHASYLDGVVMKAALPPRFSFVIKREAASMPVAGFLLKRIGSEFVDRYDEGGRRRDAKRVLRRAEQGHALVFFPEGTFDSTPGLKRFHAGAFVAAARGAMPLVPTVIHGTRRAMPNRALIVRPGRVRVEILEPLAPSDEGTLSVQESRRESRRLILARLDEPDLAPEQTRGH